MHVSYPQSVHWSKHHVLTDDEQLLLMQAASHCGMKAIKFEESKIKNKWKRKIGPEQWERGGWEEFLIKPKIYWIFIGADYLAV